jgi:Novel toxin 15
MPDNDNGTLGRIITKAGDQASDESLRVLRKKWEGVKESARTWRNATGIGVSDEEAHAARESIKTGTIEAVQGLGTLVGPPPEMVEGAYLSGNPEAIRAVEIAQAQQKQAVDAVGHSIHQAVADSYARNGTVGVIAMVATTGVVEVAGQKGVGAAARVTADAAEAAAGAAKLERIAQRVIRDEGVFIKTKKMAKFAVGCFRAGKKTRGKLAEYERQLEGQEKGLNGMTVEQYLKGRNTYEKSGRKGTGKAQKNARKLYADELRESTIAKLNNQGIYGDEAERQARKIVKDEMGGLAALHNPDLGAGGEDVITALGDKGVNSSLGGQWPQRVNASDKLSRVKALDEAANAIPPGERATTMMHVSLTRCLK